MSGLQHLTPDQMTRKPRTPVDAATLSDAAEIVEDVRRRGEQAILEHSQRFGDLRGADRIVFEHDSLHSSLAGVDPPTRSLLERTTARIRRFAEAQRSCLLDLDVEISGGRAGHQWLPVRTAGAYAPGGRYPLPSSILMTVIPARVARVEEVWVASPRPTPVTLAAAAVAGADGLLAVGGAQAIAALAFGVFTPPCDVVVGPGNRWVTAAKKHLYGEIGIDGLAGPSEIVVIADGTSDPRLVAADLLAQAEHDPDAVPALITLEPSLIPAVEEILAEGLESLSTADVASSALDGGYAVVVEDLDEAADLCNRIAPEHLALHVEAPDTIAERLSDYGSLFIGDASAEVFADYGAGPNHVLPTGGGARFQSGLSVTTFLRSPTWMTIDETGAIRRDTAQFARLEGLEAHARAAELRR
ncbi:MAG: histidinol dehydrogenase [Acidobacteria bacterium]|nr:histidinol dehydrogenase [Acidobacteriota bacterium]